MIQEYLKETGRLDQVTFQGSHCFGNCEFGPMLKINDAPFDQVNENNVISILERFFENQGLENPISD